MKVTELTALIERELPLELAVPGDPTGLQLMSAEIDTGTVAVAYELNHDVVHRAAESGAGLIVAFHPLIFAPLASIRSDAGRVESVVLELIQRRIALYIVHTAFDAHPQGTSALLAGAMGLKNIHPLSPHPLHQNAGMGAMGEFDKTITLPELSERLRLACRAEVVRVSVPAGSAAGDRRLRRVAILGGSGMSYYQTAVSAGADAFITADVRYHGFHEANDAIPVLDPGHAESERFVVPGIMNCLQSAFKEFSPGIRLVEIDEQTNPVRYFAGT